ncbi:MAG: MlaD family protein [Nitrospirota bacterium]
MDKQRLSTETKVGIFVVIVILVLAYMTFTVGGFRIGKPKGYRIYVVFDSIAGLDIKSRVKMAGVDIGHVEKLELVNGKARVTLLIEPHIKIRRDSKASIKSTGLMGEKYLEITPSKSEQVYLKEGDTITNVEEVADIDRLLTTLSSTADDIGRLTRSVHDVVGSEEGKRALKETINNLRDMTDNLRRIIAKNDERFNRIMANLDKVSENIADFSYSLKSKGPQVVDNIKAATDDIRGILEENRGNFKESLENIKVAAQKAQSALDSIDRVAQKIESGEGTLGKMVTDDRLYESINKAAKGFGDQVERMERLKFFLGARSEILERDGKTKSYFSLTLQPKDDKYYLFEVVSDPYGTEKVTETRINSTTTKETKYETKAKFSLQMSKRYKDTAVRFGLMENTFGVAGDHYLLDDKIRLSVEAWDFNADEKNANKVHLKTTASYSLFKYVFLNAGVDNILNSKRRSAFVGGGFRFEDEDLKYIFGTVPIPRR